MTITRIFPAVRDNQEPWSSVFFGMVNSLKSANKSPPLRSTIPPDEPQRPAPSLYLDATRNDTLSHSTERPSKRLKPNSQPSHRPSTRTAATADGRNPPPRPPTKLSVFEPHGEIVQTTNGVQTSIGVNNDQLQAGQSSEARIRTSDSKSQDKRTLRSQDESTRLKSELAIYFPNYEDIINDVPQEDEFLGVDTVIHLVDEPTKPTSTETPKSTKVPKSNSSTSKSQTRPSPNGLAAYGFTTSPSAQRFNGAQIVDFSSIEKSVPPRPDDPLTDAVYFKPHRRAERKEKQLRNIEKERAMHEKVQLERLLDGLKGHDWLRVLGVTGVTDSEAKRFEEKRDYFVDEVKALVLKFKLWKEEEKRMKLEKEAALLAREGEQEEDEEVEEESEQELDSSEIDASAARQLLMEASGSAKGKAKQRMPPPEPIFYRRPSPERPFTSFFAKPHLRAAALGSTRHGRNVTAFGITIADEEEREFELPADYITPDALRESARRRRRAKRESIVDSKK